MASLRNIWHRMLKPKIGSDGSIGMRLKRLEDLGSRRVKEFVKRENRYTNLQLLHTRKFQKRVKKHIHEISSAHERNIFKLSIEERTGTYVYYQRQYDDALPVIYRRCYDTDHEELVFDQNELAKETGYVQTGPLKVSTSDDFVAVVVIKDASEFCNCHIYKVDKTGSSLVDVLPNVVNAEWCNDESNIVLVTSNEVQRYCIHTRTSITILKENDPRFNIDLMKSRGQQWILVHVNSKSCSEVYGLDANNPHEDVRCLIKRDENIECYVDHWQGYFYAIRTSRENKEYMISRLPDNGKNAQWQGVYCPTNEKRVILDMEIFADNLLVYELDNLIPWLTIIPIQNIKARRSFKTSIHPAVIESFSKQDKSGVGMIDGRIQDNTALNDDPKSHIATYTLTSPILPLKVFEYDMWSNVWREVSTSLPTWRTTDFEWKIIEAKSKDGTHVPISIFYKKNIKDLCDAPMLATVYGSYGVPVDLRFSYEKSFLLENGWILAFPHLRCRASDDRLVIRGQATKEVIFTLLRARGGSEEEKGGGEFGRNWYKRATKLGKQRTFQDLTVCIEKLHESGVSNPNKTALSGMSAGGLAAAVLCNIEPTLIKAVVLKAPFIDILNTMQNEKLNLTAQEYEEWGNPRESPEDFNNIKTYCPTENLKFNKNFPAIYMTTHLDDERVPAWVPLKWIAKWRLLEQNSNLYPDNVVLCRVFDTGGHFGFIRQKTEDQISEMTAFLYTALDVPMKQQRSSH